MDCKGKRQISWFSIRLQGVSYEDAPLSCAENGHWRASFAVQTGVRLFLRPPGRGSVSNGFVRYPGKGIPRRKYNPRRDRGADAAAMREDPSERSLIMAYKKPQMVAKSSAKKSYVAGCPANSGATCCSAYNTSCEIAPRD